MQRTSHRNWILFRCSFGQNSQRCASKMPSQKLSGSIRGATLAGINNFLVLCLGIPYSYLFTQRTSKKHYAVSLTMIPQIVDYCANAFSGTRNETKMKLLMRLRGSISISLISRSLESSE
jgi:hypothetical protein